MLLTFMPVHVHGAEAEMHDPLSAYGQEHIHSHSQTPPPQITNNNTGQLDLERGKVT